METKNNLKKALQELICKVNEKPASITAHWVYEPHLSLVSGHYLGNHCNYNNGGYGNHH